QANQSIIIFEFLERKLSENLKKELSKNVTQLTFPEGWERKIVLPHNNVTNGAVGLKFFSKVFGFDFSFSFVSRVNDIPYVKAVIVSNTTTINILTSETNTVVDYKFYEIGYHKENVVGFDLSKDWDIFLTWLELSLTFPEETKRISYNYSKVSIIPLNLTTNIAVVEESTILKDPYLKFVVGLDKNFDGGWYLNFQYSRGLFIEKGYQDEGLQDYLVLNVEKTFFDDKLKFRVYSIVNTYGLFDKFNENNFLEKVIDNTAVIGAFEVLYSPVIGLNFKLGVMGIDGKEKATLSTYKDYDMVYLQISTSF
ncbi:MAG: hypothetical protein ACK4F9_07920, partial [Brevinematia bacterium]